ncbi:glycosyltransferase family 4 protein [Affinibrenneria salicis]|uniref:Glycosyltransferase family 4 protein n=1 Tax=Affinibrenneria salicis TaxID=2590031 RepID=A0A5J5FTA7_9GAMM|nr:glycosyltransferase family 4 protein [Affinibrenneria salicis]KAA8996681.1 glycosyltransferase family 4 protein [Affinibrenneria salicis]
MKIFSKKKGAGFFGKKYEYKLLNINALSIIRHYAHDEIRLFNFPIWHKNRNDNPRIILNEQKQLKNLALADSLSSSNIERRILFVVDYLQETGGVESRITRLFYFLQENGYSPMIISTYNRYKQLLTFPNFSLDYKAPNATKLFMALIETIKPGVVEFQFKSTRFFHDIDLDKLLKVTRVGCCIHEQLKIDQKRLNKLNYRTASAYRKGISNVTHILNWIEHLTPVWQYKKQSKALFISRIEPDKILTIINFISICHKNGWNFEIAGTYDKEKNRETVEKIVSLDVSKSAFIGHIDTIKHLKENVDKYLFISGVGQIPIEAASLGYPVLITPHFDNPDLSTFVTPQNITFLQHQNFVLREIPENYLSVLGNVNEFKDSLNEERRLANFLPQNEMQKSCNQSVILGKYLALLNKSENNKK